MKVVICRCYFQCLILNPGWKLYDARKKKEIPSADRMGISSQFGEWQRKNSCLSYQIVRVRRKGLKLKYDTILGGWCVDGIINAFVCIELCNMTHYGYPRIVYYTCHKPRTHLHICNKLFVPPIHLSDQPFIRRCSAVTESDAIPLYILLLFSNIFTQLKMKIHSIYMENWKIGFLHTHITYTCRVNVCQKFTLLTLTYNSCRDIDSQMHLHIIIWNRIVGEGKCHCVTEHTKQFEKKRHESAYYNGAMSINVSYWAFANYDPMAAEGGGLSIYEFQFKVYGSTGKTLLPDFIDLVWIEAYGR